MRNNDNIGFAAACNQGAAGSEADYLLFLNPDTRLFADTLVSGHGVHGRRARGEHRHLRRRRSSTRPANPAISCARFPTLRMLFGKSHRAARRSCRLCSLAHHLTAAETRQSRVVDQVIGAFFLVRRELFSRLGGFDERYFLYYEEVDFARRALPTRATVRTSSRRRPDPPRRQRQLRPGRWRDRLYHSLRSRLLFALPALATLAGDSVRRPHVDH